MINTEMRLYTYSTLGKENAYGQQTINDDVVGYVRMSINLLNQNVVDNVKYNDASYIGLTHSPIINDACVINYGEQKLKVLYVNPHGRYKQVFMKEI